MLSRRFHKLYKVVERKTLLRLYIAGSDGHSNLSTSRINGPTNLYNSSRKMTISSVTSKNLNSSSQEKIQARLLHPRIHDDDAETQLSENTLAYKVLQNSERKIETLRVPLKPATSLSDDEIERILCQDWTVLSPSEAVDAFEQLSYAARSKREWFSEAKHSEILKAFTAKLSKLDDEQLRLVFRCVSLWNRIWVTKFSAYANFVDQLDNECCKRLPYWNKEEALLMCDYFFSIQMARKASFTLSVLRKLGKKPQRLTPNEFLHYMFVINTCRKPPVNIYELEYHLSNVIDQYSVSELGIMAMAFFKCQTPIRDGNIIVTMLRKIMEDVDNVPDFCISAIMKITRYSSVLRDLDVFQNLLTKLVPVVPNLSIPCLTNMLHAAASVQCYNAALMDAVIRRFETNISEARIKDLERLSWVLGIFHYDPDTPIYHKILESLRDPARETELALYPKTIPTTLSHFSFANIFPIDLIKKSFDPEFLSRVYGNNAFKIGWDYFSLENNLKIDLPEYDGPFLKPNILEFHAKKFAMTKADSGGKMRNADKFILEVAHMCKSAVKANTPIAVEQVLPHYVKADIILCFDDENNPLDPVPILSKTKGGYIKYVPDEAKHLKWLALLLATQNQIIKGTDKYVGPLNTKFRQLEKIGYAPIILNIYEWYDCPSLESKQEYLKRKLDPVLPRKKSAATN